MNKETTLRIMFIEVSFGLRINGQYSWNLKYGTEKVIFYLRANSLHLDLFTTDKT